MPWRDALVQELGSTLLELDVEEAERRSAEFACKRLLERIRQDLGVFGIEFDEWYSEASLNWRGAS